MNERRILDEIEWTWKAQMIYTMILGVVVALATCLIGFRIESKLDALAAKVEVRSE